MKAPRLAALALIWLAGCNGYAGGAASGNGSAAAAPAAGEKGGPPFRIETLARFDQPWAIAFLPGSSQALVTEKPGRLLLWSGSGQAAEVAGVPAVAKSGQGGLLDVAPSPSFRQDQSIYLSYSEPGDGGSGLALARARLVAGERPRLEGLRVIWRDIGKGKGGQFGAIIAFSPDGRYLFLSSGERQRFTPAQDPNQPLGKILRLTLEGKPAPGNPGAGRTGASSITVIDPPENTGAARTARGRTVALTQPNLTPAETWTTGHRNTYGLAFAADGRLWETEMGPKGGDELNLIEPGRNYGWPEVSNGDNYDGTPIPDHPTRPEFQAPALWWNPAISPGGFMIYSGSLFPQWKGSGFIAALSGKALIRVELTGATARKADRWDMGARIRDVAQGPDGAIYLIEDGAGARLLRLTPSPKR
jgi:glucose/arabinose dehydrogenase